MKRLLIVSPHFPPASTPDMQRVRLLLPYLRQLGWEPVVLALDPAMIEGAVLDPLYGATYPADIRVIRVRGVPASATRWAGMGNVWWRCGRALRRAGDALLAAERFDLVFFSTTVFPAFSLGPRWRRRFGVPYVLDYQDPWVNPYYAQTRTRPPGGPVRFALSQFLARRREPLALRGAAEVIAVSAAYGPSLQARYPWFDGSRVHVLPFGASAVDLAVARAHPPAHPLIKFGDGDVHYVYAGRCNAGMLPALRILFLAFRRCLAMEPRQARRIRFHFLGTGYAPRSQAQPSVLPLATELGVGAYVHERCHRLPYFEALWYVCHADAIVAVGSDDPGYSASKIYPCILAERPLLLIYHQQSPVLAFARDMAAGATFGFATPHDADAIAEQVYRGWFRDPSRAKAVSYDRRGFADFTAESLAGRLAAVFARAADTSERRHGVDRD